MIRSFVRPASTLLRAPASALLTANAARHPTALLVRSAPRSVPSHAAPSAVSFAQRRFYSPITTDEPAKLVSFADVEKIAASTESAAEEAPLLVDVREPSEYAAGHIPTAVNIPFKSSPGALSLEAEDFEDAFGFPKPSTERELVFYCLAGVRSSAAEELAGTFGYQK